MPPYPPYQEIDCAVDSRASLNSTQLVLSLVVPPQLLGLGLEAAHRANPADRLQSQVFVQSVTVLDLVFQLLFDKRKEDNFKSDGGEYSMSKCQVTSQTKSF